MTLSRRRIRGILRKELRDYRRNRNVLVTMAIFPLIFLIQPLVAVFLAPDVSAESLRNVHLLLYMLGIPVLVPAAVAAAAVAGEREQGTLEPVLTTPIRREEFLLGKALAALLPSILIAYAVYAVFVACVVLFAHSEVAAAVLRRPDIVAQLVFTPLLASWSIWVGIAISTRASDLRVASQLSVLGSLPMLVVTSLIAFDTIHATLGLGLAAGVALLLADGLGWRVVARMFDRERLISGSR
jgi:ABC-type transport system involved in multi-copper enzyme maturation permease subunit